MPRKLRFDPAWNRHHNRAKGAHRLRKWTRSVVAIILVGAGTYWLLVPDVPPAAGMVLKQPVTLCSARGTQVCVIDGDTIMIGRRKIRMQGYNAPEVNGACAAERALAAQARAALLRWLNDGAVQMDGDDAMVRDQYGRELRRFWRTDAEPEWLANHMVEAGLARGEWDWSRDWC